MQRLSQQLSQLACRTAKLEDSVSAAQDQDRERLEAQRVELAQAMARSRAAATAAAEGLADSARTWWSGTRASAQEWFDHVRTRRAERNDLRDRAAADRRAASAEADAADAVDFAMYAIDEAEYALIDAALARADADALSDGPV